MEDPLNYDPDAKEGLKYITSQIKKVLIKFQKLTYEELIKEISFEKPNTLKRRVYDALSVMKALNIVKKVDKHYIYIFEDAITQKEKIIEMKKEKLAKLKKMRSVILRLIERNTASSEELINVQKFNAPFVMIVCDKESKLTCETNSEHSIFKFTSDMEIKRIDDIKVMESVVKSFDILYSKDN